MKISGSSGGNTFGFILRRQKTAEPVEPGKSRSPAYVEQVYEFSDYDDLNLTPE